MATNDGGPAFPHSGYSDGNGVVHDYPEYGMRLRDWFAGKALVGMMAWRGLDAHKPAESAYALADLMLEERSVDHDAPPDLLAVAKMAAAQFDFYAEQHEAKGTPESAAKAQVNRAKAAECRAAIAKAEGAA